MKRAQPAGENGWLEVNRTDLALKISNVVTILPDIDIAR